MSEVATLMYITSFVYLRSGSAGAVAKRAARALNEAGAVERRARADDLALRVVLDARGEGEQRVRERIDADEEGAQQPLAPRQRPRQVHLE